MSFDQSLYLAEMSKMLEVARERWQREHQKLPIFAVNVWTDPEAQFSAVNLETRSHSESQIAENHAFARQARERQLEQGNTRMADLFLEDLKCHRNTNPADFKFREFARTKHRSFGAAWASSPQCWDELEPYLIRVRDLAKAVFKDETLDPDAEVSINSRDSWYAHPLALSK